MKDIKNILVLACLIGLFSCGPNSSRYDATGTFEADEIIVSAEANGRIRNLEVEEGAALKKDSVVGNIDPTAIQLQKEQASSQVAALAEKTMDAGPQVGILESQLSAQRKQIAVQQEQLKVLLREQQRYRNLVAADASPAKQLDDINGQVDVLREQITASESQLAVLQSQISSQKRSIAIQNRGILSEKTPMAKRVEQIQEQLDKTRIINPVDGTVLTKYAYANEYTTIGKAIYKVADLSVMKLRAYITGDQLARVKLNQPVTVMVDDGAGKYRQLTGTVSWISSTAEFTPKTIQTKDERANLVYAVKISVKNDGYLKIGMYGEVLLAAPGNKPQNS
jgi:HlyD family secretion protein